MDGVKAMDRELEAALRRTEALAGAFRSHEALKAAREALEIARRLGDGAAVAKALSLATLCHFNRYEYHAALATGIDALEAFDRGDPAGRADALKNIALVLFALEDFEHATQAARHAVAEAAASGDPLREATARNLSGFIHAEYRRPEDARRELLAAARQYRRAGETLQAHRVASNLGHAYRRQAELLLAEGEARRARKLWRHALRIYGVALRADRTHANDAIAFGGIGVCQHMLGRNTQARESLERSLAMANGAPAIASPALLWSARVAEALGNLEGAEHYAAAALRCAEGLEHGTHYVDCLRFQARIASLRGRGNEASHLDALADTEAESRRVALAAARAQAVPLWQRLRGLIEEA